MLGLFKKKPDMKCGNCRKLISHKKVKWKPRVIDFSNHPNKELREATELINSKKEKADPNEVFGFSEYEYGGNCPECNAYLTGFWFGFDSLFRKGVKDIEIDSKPFLCNECETPINRELQVWYSIGLYEGDEKKDEVLVTLCSKCHTEQVYPFEYNLETGIIK